MDAITIPACLFLSLLSAAAFYLATPHQRLWPAATARRSLLRALGWAGSVLALAAAIVALGTWAGVFSALTAWMSGAVLLPYLDAWRQARKGATRAESTHVG